MKVQDQTLLWKDLQKFFFHFFFTLILFYSKNNGPIFDFSFFLKKKKLKPVFKENGVVTAGNASGITDGAAAVVVASEVIF